MASRSGTDEAATMTWEIRSFSARVTETKRCQRPHPANQRERKGSSLHLCSGSEVKFPYLCWLLEGRRYLCLFWLNTVTPCVYLPCSLLSFLASPTTEQPKHPHVPRPAACLRAFSMSSGAFENVQISLNAVLGELCSPQLLLQLLQQQLYEKTTWDSETFANTMWAFGWRCVSRLNLTCTRFQSAEVQSFVRPPPLSFTHTILTLGFDPGNVIQMSCIMGATALTREVEKSAHCMRTGATGTMVFHRRGQQE